MFVENMRKGYFYKNKNSKRLYFVIPLFDIFFNLAFILTS